MTDAPKPLRDSFADTALSFVDTRYQHQGRVPGLALDCAGVVVCAARAVGFDVEDVSAYDRLPDADSLTRAFDAHCVRVSPVAMQRGDILLFAWNQEPQHVGVVTEVAPYVRFVHAHTQARRVVDHALDESWSERLRVVMRLAVADEVGAV